MLTDEMEISRLMVYMQEIYEEKMWEKEEYRTKRAKAGNEPGKHKSNAN